MSERTHSAWWKPRRWSVRIWVLMFGIALMLVPFGIRAVRLARVPAMDEPFDVDEFVKWDVPDEENAFTDYRQASVLRAKIVADLVARSEKEPNNFNAVFAKGWSVADEPLKNWLDANREALAVWRRGTEKPQARYISPADLTYESSLDVIQDQMSFARLAILEATRALDGGEFEESWQWARAAFRNGGHVSHRGCDVLGMVGVTVHTMSLTGIARWAEQPAVTAEQLKRAVAETKTDFTLYETESNIFKAQYLLTRNSLLSPRWFQMIHENDAATPTTLKVFHWVVAEPEVTIRIARQMLANRIREVDKPVSARRGLASSGKVMLFNTDPAVPLAPRQLDATGINRIVGTSRHQPLLLSSDKRIDDPLLRQRARQATLEAMLAAQAYHRTQGEFPETLAQLVPEYLDVVPLDPCDSFGRLLKYRRDEPSKAIVWSVGEDTVDAGGVVGQSPTEYWADVGFALKIDH